MSKHIKSEEVDDENAFYLSNVEIAAAFEFFQLVLTSGTSKRTYLTSPSHTKRILTLLTQWVQLYEQQFGPIQSAPESKQQTGEGEKKIGFDEQKVVMAPDSPEQK